MILFNGKSERISKVLGIAILVCVLLALIQCFIGGLMRFKQAEAATTASSFLVDELIKRVLPILLVLVPLVLFLSIAKRRILRDYPSIIATDRGLRFPFFPGVEFGRFVPWEFCERVDLVRGAEDRRITSIARACTTLLFEDPLYLIVFLNRGRSQAWSGDKPLRWLYHANDAASFPPQEGADRMILEVLGIRDCLHASVVSTINTLIRSPQLRDPICGDASRFVIFNRPDGTVAFKDVLTGVETDFAEIPGGPPQ